MDAGAHCLDQYTLFYDFNFPALASNFANSIKMEARRQKERAKRLSETAEQRLQRIKLGAVLAARGLIRWMG